MARLIVFSKDYLQELYDKAHTLIGRKPGESETFQAKFGTVGFTLAFKDGTQEQVEKLERHGFKAILMKFK